MEQNIISDITGQSRALIPVCLSSGGLKHDFVFGSELWRDKIDALISF